MSIRDDLLRGYQTGNLLQAVHACRLANHGDYSAIAKELVALHNARLIDVVGAFDSLGNKTPAGSDFFLMRHIFETALPDINSPILPVMRCVLRLYRGAGQDLAAGTILNGFISFCEKLDARPREALAEIEASPDEFADLLTGTLIAGSHVDTAYYLAQAVRLCRDENMELRRRAVFSLGQLTWPEGSEVPDSCLATLECSATETDGQLLACIVRSAASLLRHHKAQEPRIIEIISSALSKGDDYTLHAASEVFGLHTEGVTAPLLDALLVQLARVNPKNKGTLNNLDYGISRLLKSCDPEKALRFLEDLLLTHPEALTMKAFDSTAGDIARNNTLISKVLTRWFLRGDRVLCAGVESIVGAHHGTDLPLDIDPSELKPADSVHIVFVARKAIGYLFTRPISAAAVLISLMRNTADDEALEALGALLFDPLLLNYSGKAREYVQKQSQQETGKVKATMGQALRAIDQYLADLRAVGNLEALHPGERQREAHHRHISRLMAESWKAAETHSTFLHLFPKSVLLYGRKSVNYVHGADGQAQRMEIPLRAFGAEMEFPRMEYLDPFGLDYMLRVFKTERVRT